MIIRETIEGRPARVAYVMDDMTPASVEAATQVKIIFDDGGIRYARRIPMGDAWNEALHPRDEEGQFAASGSGSSSAPLPPKVVDAFTELGRAQRGAPEIAMTKVQYANGGGAINPLVEHAGDLTHRMSEMAKYGDSGYDAMKEKVPRLRRQLGRDDLKDDIETNFKNNAASEGISVADKKAKVYAAMDKYVAEHEKLPVYNEAQWRARQAAILIGMREYDLAWNQIDKLNDMMPDEKTWESHAFKYELDEQGNPKQWTPGKRETPAPSSPPELDEIMTREEVNRYNALEETYKNHTPVEAEEYKRLQEKFDARWNKAIELQKAKEDAEWQVTRRGAMKRQANAIARSQGFDETRIDVVEGTRTFEVNGVQHTAAGDADIHNKEGNGHIRLYADHLTGEAAIAAVTAHEIEHFKFEYARQAYQREYDQVMKDPGPEPDPNAESYPARRGGTHGMMNAQGDLRPPYDQKYPLYNAWHNATADFEKLEAGDGVSAYSAEYWKGWHEGKINTDIAMHETLAEMAAIKFTTGKFPEHYGFSRIIRERNEARPLEAGEDIVPMPSSEVAKIGRTKWRDLYRLVDQVWKTRK